MPQVINYSMPASCKQYIHRVGRTARARRSGRSITLVGEKGRKVLKEVVRRAKKSVKSRILPPGEAIYCGNVVIFDATLYALNWMVQTFSDKFSDDVHLAVFSNVHNLPWNGPSFSESLQRALSDGVLKKKV